MSSFRPILSLPKLRRTSLLLGGIFKNHVLCILPSFLLKGPGKMSRRGKVSLCGTVPTAAPQWPPLSLPPALAAWSPRDMVPKD